MSTNPARSEAPATALRVLLIEDCSEDAVSVERNLARSRRPRFAVEVAPTWAAGRSALESNPPDVVLLDLKLPDAEGLDLVRSATQIGAGVPLVILTGSDEDQTALQALHLGAQDYLVKSDLDTNTLRRSVRHAIERHQILESLARANRERIEMKDQLLSHVSHELLTPLSAIYQFIDILKNTVGVKGEETAEQQRKCLEVLLRNAIQLRRMIGDLMEATRIETGKLNLDAAVFDLRRCLENAIRSAEPDAQRSKLALAAELAADLPTTLADENRVCQIAANLLSNAIKFTPAGGRITVRAEHSREEPDFLHVMIADTGRGISPEALPHIFDRLYQDRRSVTGSRKGLGLGLYICREVIAQLGGRIWAESEPGAGSRFHFTLPVHSTERFLLGRRADATRPAVLIVVTVGSPGSGAHGSAPEELLAEIYAVLPRLVWNQYDIVLPRRRMPGGELLAVVAQTDGPGATAMAARFERAIGELRASLAETCRIRVSFRELRTAQGSTVAELGAHVDALLEAALAEA